MVPFTFGKRKVTLISKDENFFSGHEYKAAVRDDEAAKRYRGELLYRSRLYYAIVRKLAWDKTSEWLRTAKRMPPD